MSHDFPNPQNPHPQAQHHGGAAPHGAADLSALGPHGTPEHYAAFRPGAAEHKTHLCACCTHSGARRGEFLP